MSTTKGLPLCRVFGIRIWMKGVRVLVVWSQLDAATPNRVDFTIFQSADYSSLIPFT